ncbi:MAG TPA: UDP-GlcNAc--UDP-phosphate GlcNAc-1-phosphate transferase [Bacteroidales bacterium]|nr:UDP-GlcNAc--UDP-phosphate GlcNAc-1-phosphate transferase [Bacteroidales bacterium]
MILYPVSAFVLLATLLLYFKLAERYQIIDRPNERSSHRGVAIRGGGIVFPLAALLWFVSHGFALPWLIAGLLLVAAVSFLDDLRTLPGSIRFLVQFIAVSLMLLQLDFVGLPWYLVIPLYILLLGWINAFNFLDGINAITPFYSLAALGSFMVLNHRQPFAPPPLLILLIIAVVIFSFFNARRLARTFAGDVGSISMAFLLGYLMICLVSVTGRFEYVLFFIVYALDSVVTILYRLFRRENIFRAHRSHLYQWLSNELGWPHVLVASLYAVVQLMINIFTIVLIRQEIMKLSIFLVTVAVLSLVYLVIRCAIGKRIGAGMNSH